MVQLRDYQSDFCYELSETWRRVRAVLGVLPTGAGKTVCFSSVIAAHVGYSIAVVHRREILTQISVSLAREGVKHRIIAPPATVRRIREKHFAAFGKSYEDANALCAVASVQTLTSAATLKNSAVQAFVGQVTLAVYDEGHHYVNSGVWAKAVDMFPRAKLLFVSATPDRADGKGLGAGGRGYAEEMVEGPSTDWLIKNGYLSKYQYFAPDSDLDIEGVPITATGDLNTKAMRARVEESHLVGDVVQHYLRFAAGTKAIVFAESIATAADMEHAFRAAGVRAVQLNGGTDEGERDRAITAFAESDIMVLINVDLFDEGFDVPAAVTAILARPTMSLAKYLQMCGRVLRIMDGKDYAVIIDPVRNWARHGFPDTPRSWSLDDRPKGERAGDSSSDAIPSRPCRGCTQPYRASLSVCPYCGFEYVPEDTSSIKRVEGDLFALDTDAFNALVAARKAAAMPADEYELSLMGRPMDPRGRAALVKSHRTAQTRRAVLYELVGWWVGLQEGRPMDEIYRVFWHRTGVDMESAFALDARETDALIDKLTRVFDKDVICL